MKRGLSEGDHNVRREKLLIATVLIFGFPVAVCAQTSLPACSGEVATWNECSGTQDLSDGTKYVGEFRNGQPDGKGTLSWKDGDQYTGDFKAGVRHGTGTVTLAKVAKVSGRWVDGRYMGR